MSTESEARARNNGGVSRLALALVDIFTGVTEASVVKSFPSSNQQRLTWTLHVKKVGTQDS